MSDNEQEVEASRLERLREITPSNPGLDDAAHKTAVLLKAIDDHLAGHPAIVRNPGLYRLVYRSFENLFLLHQIISSESLKGR